MNTMNRTRSLAGMMQNPMQGMQQLQQRTMQGQGGMPPGMGGGMMQQRMPQASGAGLTPGMPIPQANAAGLTPGMPMPGGAGGMNPQMMQALMQQLMRMRGGM